MRGRKFASQQDIDRHIANGFGGGAGASYVPWLRVQDVPSIGRSHKIQGVKIDRIHHLLSDLERSYFLVCEFSEDVVEGSKRTLEKLEIEKRFWQSQGVDWKIVTDEFFTRDLIKNLGLIRKYSKLPRDLMKVSLHSNFIDCLANSREYPWTLATCLRKIASLLSISYIDAQAIFFHLVWNKGLKIDLVSSPLHLTGLVPDFEVIQNSIDISMKEKMS